MDPNLCLNILQQRHCQKSEDNCPCGKDLHLASRSMECQLTRFETEERDDLVNLSNIDIVNALTEIQGERVKTYTEFEKEFNKIMKDSELGLYPSLCTKVTEQFQQISKSILQIKKITLERSLNEVTKQIEELQRLEKEKLLLIAALHADTIQSRFTIFRLKDFEVLPQTDYVKSQIEIIERGISDAMENIQTLKCDLLESEDS